MIKLDSVSYAYSDTTPIFQDFSWQVERGEAWVVIGPSGCGKSTLLYLLAGLRFPTSGKLLIDGEPLTRPRPQTGLILQEYGLLPWATVRQNSELGLRVRRFYGPDGTHAPLDFNPTVDVDPWLEHLGVASVSDKYPSQISGGQRQRTAIARTLALKPDLLLMDEPFGSLDAPTRESLQELTLELWKKHNLTLVTVTHAIEEAVILGQKILILGNPPNRNAEIIPNLGFDTPGFQQSEAYLELRNELRTRMG